MVAELTQPIIHLDHVTKNYKDPASNVHFQALRGIDLKLKKGSFSSIIGPSGAGKSSLLNILGGIIPPSTGNVIVDGVNLNNLTNSDKLLYRRQMIGFLWQFPERNLLPKISIEKNIHYAMSVAGYPIGKRKLRVKELLKSVGLDDRKNHQLGALSGGEAQRASLAVALANEPIILLADEPTGELDTETTLMIIDYLRDINSEEDTTVVVVTHDSRFEKMSDSAYYILDGTIAGVRRTNEKIVRESTSFSIDERVEQLNQIQQEEVGFINQFGQVKIPEWIRLKYSYKDYIKFIENFDLNKIVLEAVEEELSE